MVKQLLKVYVYLAFSLLCANEFGISTPSDANGLNFGQDEAYVYKNMWLQEFSKLSIEEQKFLFSSIESYCSLVRVTFENKDIYKKMYLTSQVPPHEELTDKEKNVIRQFESLEQYFIGAFNNPLRRKIEKYLDFFSDITDLAKIMDIDQVENICTITQDEFSKLDAYMNELLEATQAMLNSRL